MERTTPIGQVSVMINSEEDLPNKGRNLLVPQGLDSLGVAELSAYIGDLEAEIARVRAKIASKDAHKAAAGAFFKTPGQEQSA